MKQRYTTRLVNEVLLITGRRRKKHECSLDPVLFAAADLIVIESIHLSIAHTTVENVLGVYKRFGSTWVFAALDLYQLLA